MREAFGSSPGLLWYGGLAGVVGCAAGCVVDRVWLWVGLSLVVWCSGWLVGRAWRGVVVWLLVAAVFAGWAAVGQGRTCGDDLRHYLVRERRLVAVTGEVVEAFAGGGGSSSVLAGFGYRPETRTGVLAVSTITVEGVVVAARGRLLVHLSGEGEVPGVGARIEARGWVTEMERASNPGGFDARAFYARRGVYGRLRVGAGSWDRLEGAGWLGLRGLRAGVSGVLSERLLAGLDAEHVALVDAVVLGRRGAALEGLSEAFRMSGLAHLLAISGTHIGLVVLLTAGLLGLVIRHPRWRLVVCVVVLLAYLAVLPGRASVVRSGVMAVSLMMAAWSGRRLSGFDALGLAALVILGFDPVQVLEAGFELSFAAVAGILLWVRWRVRVAAADAGSAFEDHRAWGGRVRRWVVSVGGAGVAAWLATMPVAAWHFGWVVLAGPVLTLIATPVLMGVLGVGLLKMLVGLVTPAVDGVLAWVLGGLTACLIGMADVGASLPGLAWEVPSTAEVAGWFAGGDDSLRVTYLSVGSGNAYVVRWPDGRWWMVDAGGYPGAGEGVVLPALRALGVGRLETLVVTHSDLDHYAAVPEVLSSVGVGRVVVPVTFPERDEVVADSAVGVLWGCLDASGVAVERVSAGWSEDVGGARVEAVWPEAGAAGLSDNDGSLVLLVAANGCRVLFTGDLAAEGIAGVGDGLAGVDVVDVPHHGSRKPEAMAWVAGLGPEVAVQSSGWPRSVGVNPWAVALPGVGLFETWRDGCVTVVVGRDGGIEVGVHLDGGGR
ncbi:ComEC/Rec2 family competence protein [Mucisphaera calidilacus]|uniref:ComEC family competence protein n=1 Tax=Mucisphaera calidilacus TaxID=2527982 RepID=A0A518BUK0_9BACT|nr:ComEC/Rec2 family competence protein [Mucisphaera calidilacus]QDU70665.1 ComEC family competence protein [Mucisphaera calidilacus]